MIRSLGSLFIEKKKLYILRVARHPSFSLYVQNDMRQQQKI